jgi:hypothetical protein
VLRFGFKQNSFGCAVKNKICGGKNSPIIIFSLSPLRLHSSERRQRALKE